MSQLTEYSIEESLWFIACNPNKTSIICTHVNYEHDLINLCMKLLINIYIYIYIERERTREKERKREFFDIAAGVLLEDTSTPYFFIICLDYVF